MVELYVETHSNLRGHYCYLILIKTEMYSCNLVNLPSIKFHHQNPFTGSRVRRNKPVEANGRILSTRAEHLFWNVVHFLIPLFLPSYFTHFIHSLFQPFLFFVLKRTAFQMCARPPANVRCTVFSPTCVLQHWKLRCYRVYTSSCSQNCLPSQFSCMERWSCGRVITKLFLLDGQEPRTLVGPSWVVIREAYFLNNIFRKRQKLLELILWKILI